jgi:F-type H+-transporting ATPase subunit b
MDVSIKLIIYQAINFLVLMAVIGYLFNKFLRPFLHKRTDEIKKSFDEIEKQKKEMELLKQQYNDQVGCLKDKAKLEIEKAIGEGTRMRDDIIAEARKESGALVERAKSEIDHEKQKAIMELQREVASLCLQATQHLIKKKMDDSTNRQLVENFLEDLVKNPPEKT